MAAIDFVNVLKKSVTYKMLEISRSYQNSIEWAFVKKVEIFEYVNSVLIFLH